MEALSPAHVALGQAIRHLRERCDLSQEGLAHAAGLHRTYVGGIERGEQNPTFSSLVQVAGALGVKLSELVVEYEARAR